MTDLNSFAHGRLSEPLLYFQLRANDFFTLNFFSEEKHIFNFRSFFEAAGSK